MTCMRIPLDVLDGEINLTATVRAPHVCGSVNFMTDTGSNTSFIGSVDMQKLGISQRRLQFSDKIFWGDAPFRLGKLRKVALWVKTADHTVYVFHLPFIFVSPDFIHTKEGNISPNLLGLDFLRAQKLQFCFDGVSNSAYFETSK